jgi:peptidoglycan hydrolase-like protein with peptidoglycan-binding domain
MIIKVNHLVAVLILIISFSIPSTILASENVLATQKKLNEMGFNAGTADGIWGNTTKNALIEYLSTKGLKFDGSLDKNEFELLEIKNIRNEKLSFRFNIDKSLPEDWVSEFKNIIEILQEVLPVEENFNNYVKNSAMDIYAWNSKVKNPFSEKPNMGGASVSGDGKTKWMVLEINKDEFKYNSPHRYS